MSRVKVALDFNIAERVAAALGEMYGSQGFEFIHLKTLVDGATPDVVWADVFRQVGGRYVLSGDCRIAYRPHEAVAFIDNGLVSVFPDGAWSKLRGNARAAFLIYHWPDVVKWLAAVTEGSCWKLPVVLKDGELRLSPCPPERLKIPPPVLATARAQRMLA